VNFVSTRGQSAPVTFATALVDGLAPDGGLYVPERIPSLDPRFINRIATTPMAELGAEVLAPYVAPDIDRATLERLVAQALDFPIPLRHIADNIYVLELFHGPTLAFKDVGARTLARFTAELASVQVGATMSSSSRGRGDHPDRR
jgi:threonine synthase